MTTTCQAWIRNEWREISVETALARPKLLVRCAQCHGAVRLHREGHGGSTRAHVEHRIGFSGCSRGNYFDGNHRHNPNPVASPQLNSEESLSGLVVTEFDEASYPEGRERFRQHQGYERNGTIPNKAKVARLKEYGTLACEACGFDFKLVYGELGDGFIEAHHIKPVSEGVRRTRISDLALLCSNCHRIIHRAGESMSVEELKSIIDVRRKT